MTKTTDVQRVALRFTGPIQDGKVTIRNDILQNLIDDSEELARVESEGGTGYITVTTTQSGECIAVTRQDEEHRILSVIWERKKPLNNSGEENPVKTKKEWVKEGLITAALLVPFLISGVMAGVHMMHQFEGVDQTGAVLVYGMFTGIFFSIWAGRILKSNR